MNRAPAPGGPRGPKGADASQQGLVTTTAQIDRKEVQKRLSNKSATWIEPATAEEWDVVTGEFLVTKQIKRLGDNPGKHRIPVLTTVAGLDPGEGDKNSYSGRANPNKVLDGLFPAGISMTRIVYKPENASVVSPQTDLASQIAGVFTAPTNGIDAPFGGLMRLEVNNLAEPSYGHVGTNKSNLIMKVDPDSSPFGARLQAKCYDYFQDDSTTPKAEKAPSEEAMDAFYDALADFAMMGHVAWLVASRMKNGGGAVTEEGQALEMLELMTENDSTSQKFRRDFMRAMFAGLGPSKTMETPLKSEYLVNPNYGNRAGENPLDPTAIGQLHKRQIETSSKMFAGLMDAVRVDNIWAFARIIRSGTHTADGMMI